jgi:hypothetical protein
MLCTPLLTALTQVEFNLGKVAAALETGEPVALVQASAALRQSAVALSPLVQRLTPQERQDKELAQRLKQVSAAMAAQRQGLTHRSVLVARALHVVVPATRESTYATTGGPYGSAVKQTGAFKYLSA